MVRRPWLSASRSRPSRAGMVLLGDTAREAVETAPWSRAFSQLNFIETPPLVEKSNAGISPEYVLPIEGG